MVKICNDAINWFWTFKDMVEAGWIRFSWKSVLTFKAILTYGGRKVESGRSWNPQLFVRCAGWRVVGSPCCAVARWSWEPGRIAMVLSGRSYTPHLSWWSWADGRKILSGIDVVGYVGFLGVTTNNKGVGTGGGEEVIERHPPPPTFFCKNWYILGL